MTFPAVTLCNLNQFKLTPMHELGLIDALSVLNSEGFVQGGCLDMFIIVHSIYYWSDT